MPPPWARFALRTEGVSPSPGPGSYVVSIVRMYDITPDGQRFLMIKPAETTEEGPADQVILVQNWFEELKRLVPTD